MDGPYRLQCTWCDEIQDCANPEAVEAWRSTHGKTCPKAPPSILGVETLGCPVRLLGEYEVPR